MLSYLTDATDSFLVAAFLWLWQSLKNKAIKEIVNIGKTSNNWQTKSHLPYF